MQLALILALLLAIAVAVFAVQNSIPVTVSFLLWEAQTSVVVLVLASALAGVLISALFAAARGLRLSSEIRDLRRRLREVKAAEASKPPPSPHAKDE